MVKLLKIELERTHSNSFLFPSKFNISLFTQYDIAFSILTKEISQIVQQERNYYNIE